MQIAILLMCITNAAAVLACVIIINRLQRRLRSLEDVNRFLVILRRAMLRIGRDYATTIVDDPESQAWLAEHAKKSAPPKST